MVSKIHIERYKSILNQDIELKNLNILIGQNGAGKSNFISLFKFLERLSEQQLDQYIFQTGGINNVLYNGFAQSDYIKVSLEFPIGPNTINYYNFKLSSNGEDYRFEQEEIGIWDKKIYSNPYNFDITSSNHEANLKNRAIDKSTNKGYTAKHIFDYIRDLRVFHFHDTSENAQCKLPQDISDIYEFRNEAQNLAPYLFYLHNDSPEVYQKITEVVKLVYPRFNDFELQESPSAKGKIVLRWSEKDTENIFSSKQISDGTLRFICLATLLLQPKNSSAVPQTIVLDEPELGLHPFAIHVLSELIKKAALERQLIIATQSVSLINHFMPEDLLIVERTKNGDSIFIRKENEQFASWLEDYSLGQLWENNFLGGRP